MARQGHTPELNCLDSGIKKALFDMITYYRVIISNTNSYKKHFLLTFRFYILK